MGCEHPAQAAVWIDNEDDEYFTCPIKLLSDNVVDWYNEFAWDGKTTAWSQCSAKYSEAARYYEHAYNEYGDKQRNHGSDDSLQLRARFEAVKNGRKS